VQKYLKQKSIQHIILIILLSLIAYSNVFNSPFHFDDKPAIINNPIIKDLSFFLEPSRAKAFKGIKANDETRDIPVVLLTAVGEAVPTTTYTHADGMSTEADDYIAKPIDTEGLWEVVSGLLE